MLAFRVNQEITLQLLGLEHSYPLFRCVLINRAHLGKWFQWVRKIKRIEDVESFILESWERAKEGIEYQFGIWWQRQLVGVISAHSIDRYTDSGEIGYWMARSAEGRGIMTQATDMLLQFLFMEQHLNRVEIRCADSNQRSQAIPKRLGFRLAGVLRQAERVMDRLEDLYIYECLKEDWMQMNTRGVGKDGVYHLYSRR